MDYLPQIALYALVAVFGIFFLVALMGSLPVLSMHRARLEPLCEGEARECLAQVLSEGVVDATWADANNFHPTGVYTVTDLPGTPKAAIWTHDDEATYLCVYLIASVHSVTDFVTVHDEEGEEAVTTNTSKDSQFFPTPPGNWMQSFTVGTVLELWNHHQTAIEFLASTGEISPEPISPNVVKHFQTALRGQAAHIRSHLLWPLRVPYWYFVRRNIRHNKSVRQLMKG